MWNQHEFKKSLEKIIEKINEEIFANYRKKGISFCIHIENPKIQMPKKIVRFFFK